MFDLSISPYLLNLFKKTTQPPIIIASLDDILKKRKPINTRTQGIDLVTKKIIFGESRKAITDGYFLKVVN